MNKKQYIKKVVKLLGCSRQQKRKIQLDLENDIEMALKQGESLEDIIQRMGAPEEVAREFNENMGVQPPRSHKKNDYHYHRHSCWCGLSCFSIYTFYDSRVY